MESRYALREVEGAIGYDCRRLNDGRLASFRHTFLHRRLRRDFLERRDLISYLRAAYISRSCLALDPRIGLDASLDAVFDSRKNLVKTSFPYIDFGGSEEHVKVSKEVRYEDYSEYFDELDRLEEMNRRSEGSSSDSGSDGEPPEGGDGSF